MKNKYFAVVISVSLLMSNCKTEDWSLAPSPIQSNENSTIELSKNAKVIPDTWNKTLSEISEIKLVFKSTDSFFDKIKTGDILIGSASEAAPNGYLRTIQKIEKNEIGYVFYTTQASLEQAIVNGNIHIEKPIEFYDESPASRKSSYSKTISKIYDFDQILYDRDGYNSTTTDQVKANTKITIGATLFLDMIIQNSQLKYFKTNAVFSGTNQQSIAIGGATNATPRSIYEYYVRIPSVTIKAGLVPIVIAVDMELYLDYQGFSNAKTNIFYSENFTATPQISFQNSAWGYGYTKDFSARATKPTTPNLNANITTGVRPTMNFAIYGCSCASAYVELQSYAKLTTSGTSKTMKVGLAGGAGANLLGYSKSNSSIFDYIYTF